VTALLPRLTVVLSKIISGSLPPKAPSETGGKEFATVASHYKKNAYYRRSEFVGNGHNPSVIMFYRQTFDGQIFIGKHVVDNPLPTDNTSLSVITDGQIRRSCCRLLPKVLFVGNYRRPHPSENPFVQPLPLTMDTSVDNYRQIFPR